MLKKYLTAVISIIIILAASFFYFNSEKPPEVYIERVIDGDTVETAAGESIRLLGVDTPEIDWENNNSEFYAEAAREFSREQLLDQNVLLRFDEEREDDYGRTLAYIYHDGENFNQKLLAEGYASIMIVEPNDKYEEEFKETAEKARQERKGVWSQVLEFEKRLPVISYQQAHLFIGERVIVEGEIVNTAATDSVNFLIFSDNYRSTLSLVIFNRSLNKFSYQPAEYLKNKKIKALGTVEIYQGTPQIVIDDPYDLYIVDQLN
mgnify:FL=1